MKFFFNYIYAVIFLFCCSLLIPSQVFAVDEPKFIYLFKSDDASTVTAGLSAGDTISMIFFPSTNEPLKDSTNNALTKANVDSFFTFSESIGSDYTGKWLDPYAFQITIVDPGAAVGNNLNALTITTKTGANIKNAELTSDASTTSTTDNAVFFLGSLDAKQGPFLTGFVAEDPDGSDPAYSDGDTLTLRFSEATNEPLKGDDNSLTKAQVDTLMSFGQMGGSNTNDNLGTDYTGTWVTPSTFRITIVDSTGATPPRIGFTNATIFGASTDIKNAAETSARSNSIYANVTGSFGTFSETKNVATGGELFTRFPSGQYQLFKHDSADTESITVAKTTASTTTSDGSATFVTDVVNITGDADACTSSCSVTYEVTQDDLDKLGVSSSALKVLHDRNDDGDFDESGEVLTTSVSSGILADSFVVSATDDRISKFAVGGVVSTTSAQASAGAAAAFGLFGLFDTCDEDGFGQGQSLMVYDIMYDKCTEGQVKVYADTTCGPMTVKIGDAYGVSIAGMSSNQPLLNNDTKKVIYNHPIESDLEWFSVIITDKKDEFTDKIYTNQCTGTMSFTGNTGYTSEQQGLQIEKSDIGNTTEQETTGELEAKPINKQESSDELEIDKEIFDPEPTNIVPEIDPEPPEIVLDPEPTDAPSWLQSITKWFELFIR